MARARNIKPSFFTNEELVELPFETRLLFIGLWTLADREGRLEDRPKRIKMNVFPADEVDVAAGLYQLAEAGFIERYEEEGIQCIQVVNFVSHQNPHKNERPSTLPAPDKHGASNVQAHEQHGGTHADSHDSLNPDTPPVAPQGGLTANRFDEFWAEYPNRVEKKKSLEKWKRKRLDRIADTIIADVQERKKRDRRWLEGFIPNPTTYLNGERWEDEIQEPSAGDQKKSSPKPPSLEEL